jgi:hypothetical protein
VAVDESAANAWRCHGPRLDPFKEQFHRLADANSVSETAALRVQGLRSGPKLAFLSDGEDSIR